VYPSVDRINPILIPRTTRITYTIISDNYFNARQKQALKSVLEAAFAGISSKITLQTDRAYQAPEHGLQVKVEPMDSLGGPGSFKVFETLRDTLQPRRPYAAVGCWMQQASTPAGMYVLGLRFLGISHKATKKLEGNLEQLPSVYQLFSAPSDDTNFHFFLVVKGDPLERTGSAFRQELRELGSSLVVTYNDQPWEWEIIGSVN